MSALTTAMLTEYESPAVAGSVARAIDRGDRDGFYLEVAAANGTQRLVGRRSGGRGAEVFVDYLEGHLIGSVTGDAWLVQKIAECGATDVHVPEATLRASIAAEWGDRRAEESLRALIRENVVDRCDGVVFYWPATCAADAPKSVRRAKVKAKVARDLERGDAPKSVRRAKVKAKVARDLERGDVTVLSSHEVPLLIQAMTCQGVGIWRGLPTEGGSVVVLTSGGRYSGRVVATLHEAGSRTRREDAWSSRLPVSLKRWTLDQLTAQHGGCAVVLVEDELLAAGEHDESVRIDLEALAKDGNVAVAVMQS